MSRAPGLCAKCGGPKRGRAARVAAPIATCESCRGMICEKHARWQGDYYLCYKCERLGKKSDVRIDLPPEEKTLDVNEEVMPYDDASATWTLTLYFAHYFAAGSDFKLALTGPQSRPGMTPLPSKRRLRSGISAQGQPVRLIPTATRRCVRPSTRN